MQFFRNPFKRNSDRYAKREREKELHIGRSSNCNAIRNFVEIGDKINIVNLKTNKVWICMIKPAEEIERASWDRGWRNQRIVSRVETNVVSDGKQTISEKTPLAMAVLGKVVGQTFSYAVQDFEKVEGKILGIEKENGLVFGTLSQDAGQNKEIVQSQPEEVLQEQNVVKKENSLSLIQTKDENKSDLSACVVNGKTNDCEKSEIKQSLPYLTKTAEENLVTSISFQMLFSNKKDNLCVTKDGEFVKYTRKMKEELRDALRRGRLETSRDEKISAFIIFSNTELDKLVNCPVLERDHLYMINGFSKVKVEKYGKDIVDITKRYFANQGVVKIAYGANAFDLSAKKVKAFLGFVGLLERVEQLLVE